MKRLIIAAVIATASFGAVAAESSCAGYAAFLVQSQQAPVSMQQTLTEGCQAGVRWRKEGRTQADIDKASTIVIKADKQYQRTGVMSDGAKLALTSVLVGFGGQVE